MNEQHLSTHKRATMQEPRVCRYARARRAPAPQLGSTQQGCSSEDGQLKCSLVQSQHAALLLPTARGGYLSVLEEKRKIHEGDRLFDADDAKILEKSRWHLWPKDVFAWIWAALQFLFQQDHVTSSEYLLRRAD